jgi:CelD/BcsL family acetyltransferase involved in cellulose biosynthesis
MYIKHIVDVSDLPLSREVWNELVSQNETNTIFQTYEWFISWYKTFADTNKLYLIVVYDDGTPIGFAPLVQSKERFKRKTIQLAGYNNADYLDFVTPIKKQIVVNAIIDYLFDSLDEWNIILLNNVPIESSTSTLLKEACKRHGLQYMENNQIRCPYLQIYGQHNEINKLLNKYSNKRPYNYFRRQGNLEFRTLPEGETSSHLPVFFSQHIQRWSDTDTPSLFNAPKNKLFYRNLSEQLSATDWLHFSVLELDKTPLAYHYGFDYEGKYYWYKPSFNIDYSPHSPGTLLIRFLMQSALAYNRKELDFTIGNEPFKSRFTNKVRYNANINIFRHKRSYWLNNALSLAGKIKRRFFDKQI